MEIVRVFLRRKSILHSNRYQKLLSGTARDFQGRLKKSSTLYQKYPFQTGGCFFSFSCREVEGCWAAQEVSDFELPHRTRTVLAGISSRQCSSLK